MTATVPVHGVGSTWTNPVVNLIQNTVVDEISYKVIIDVCTPQVMKISHDIPYDYIYYFTQIAKFQATVEIDFAGCSSTYYYVNAEYFLM